MIVTNTYVEYDTDGHFYYLTPLGVDHYTGYDTTTEWNAKRSWKQGRQLHRYLTRSPYNAVGKYKNHRDIIEYSIFKNSNDERQQVIDMLIEFAEAAWDSDYDRIAYEESGTAKMPASVIDVANQGNLKFTGRIYYTVPADEYRVGY